MTKYFQRNNLWWATDVLRDGAISTAEYGPWQSKADAADAVKRIADRDDALEQYDGHADEAGAGFTQLSAAECDAILARYPLAEGGDYATWQRILVDPEADKVRQALQSRGMSRHTWNDYLQRADASRGRGAWMDEG